MAEHERWIPPPHCVQDLVKSGWKITYDATTKTLWARHPLGGDQKIAEILAPNRTGFDGDDIGNRMAAWLKTKYDDYPIFDILQRLYRAGYYTDEQDGRWWLFDKGGEGISSGRSFRDLCVNIVLQGL